MSASAYFRRVSSRTVEQLLADPARIKNVLFPSSTETVIDDEVLITIGEGYEYLDEALAPNQFIRTGGARIGDVVVGEGPARGFVAAGVRKIAAKLALVSVEDMGRKLRETALPPDAPPISELVESYTTLRELIMITAQAEAGMIIYIG